VAARGSHDDGSIADLPWASVFDPASNVRALSAIQARGFRAATEVIDRLVKATDSQSASKADVHRDSRDTDGDRDVDRAVSTWQDLVGQLATSIRGSGMPPHFGAATFDLAKSHPSGQVRFDVAQSGMATTEVWLHNGGFDDLGTIRLRCSGLLAHDGAIVSAVRVRFEPEAVPLPARSSRGITMCIDVADDIPSGCYRGTLLAEGHADVWLPVELVVSRAEP
jgi:hypothetical protein